MLVVIGFAAVSLPTSPSAQLPSGHAGVDLDLEQLPRDGTGAIRFETIPWIVERVAPIPAVAERVDELTDQRAQMEAAFVADLPLFAVPESDDPGAPLSDDVDDIRAP